MPAIKARNLEEAKQIARNRFGKQVRMSSMHKMKRDDWYRVDFYKNRLQNQSSFYQIQTPSGYLMSRFEGTRKEAGKWAKDHYSSYKIVKDKEFKW